MDDTLVPIDDLILRFNGTADGQAMIAAYQAARIIRNLGTRHDVQPPAPPVPAAK